MNTPQQKPFKVLLIGDSCIDNYVYGEVTRLNPEAPVPILNYKRTETKKGMAWNVFNNLNAFGVEVVLMTNSEIITKTRYIEEKSNHQILRLDDELECTPLSFNFSTDGYDAIVISDYNKGFITSDFLFKITSNPTCPIFIDTKKTIVPDRNCFIKINDIEYSLLQGKYSNLIITRGSSGAEYKGILYPGEKVNVYDVVGAGDTFLAALTFGYLKYKSIEKALPLANKCAAISVSNPGTYVLSNKDVKGLRC
jgi:D-beta-D-heptose 7-phosphate kinase/D-beta-D-heptose 1-phosphate adenosyltransferase